MKPDERLDGPSAGDSAEEPFDPGLRPPFAPAPGSSVSDEAVIAAFAQAQESGHSPLFYAEGPVLMIDGDIPAAIRVAPATVLVSLDLPDAVAGHRAIVEAGLAGAGLELLDEETLWGLPIAIQLAGLRLGRFDLWGVELEESFAAVRVAAIGDDSIPPA